MTFKRIITYLVGMVSLAFGIIISSKSGLGVSPLVSLAYCVSEIKELNFANCCMVMYVVFFLIEEAVKFRKVKWYDILQLPFCFLFTRIMNAFSALLPTASNLYIGLILIVPAVLFIGLGIVLMTEMRMVPNPADGLVQAVSDRTGMRMGLVKNIFDCICVAASLTIGLCSVHKVVGVSVGTIVTMFCNGRAVALFKKLLRVPLAKIYTPSEN